MPAAGKPLFQAATGAEVALHLLSSERDTFQVHVHHVVPFHLTFYTVAVGQRE